MDNKNFNPQTDPLKQNQDTSKSGPQFGSAQTETNGWRKWISKYGSSVILPIIALLILAGGIYLYSSQKSDQPGINLAQDEQNQLTEQEILDMIEQGSLEEGQEESQETTESATGEKEAIDQIIPEEVTDQGEAIKVKAGAGDGITHLARYALREYLKENPQELTNEHKIYIEDYLKDQIGSRPLKVGEELSFSKSSIEQAINAANQLTDQQLKNLEKYSAQVVWN